jgi:hypothetical protein
VTKKVEKIWGKCAICGRHGLIIGCVSCNRRVCLQCFPGQQEPSFARTVRGDYRCSECVRHGNGRKGNRVGAGIDISQLKR